MRRNTSTAYLVAVLWAVAALLVRLVLNAVIIGNRGSYLFFLLATLCSAAVGGFRSGLVTIVSGVLLAGFTRPPVGSFQLIDPSDPTAIVRFVFSALVVSYVCELLIAARERARTAERRLLESQRIYQAIGESIPFGIWICDADGRNRYISESLLKLTGLTQQECSGFGWARALHPEDREQLLTRWQECVKQAGIWDVEMRYRDTAGKYHPVLTRGVPVRDENGGIVSWAGISLDISRLKEAQAELRRQAEELRRSNRDLEQFAFVASHDMQEPLRTVNIYTHLLLKKIKTEDSPELEQFAGFVRDGVHRMESLIRDLLEYSRVLQSETERLPVDAERIAREAVDICQVSVQQSGAEVDIGVLPRVFVGEAQLRQIFQNLVSNSLKYRKRDVPPRLRISGEVQGQQVLFMVEDNGIGFAPEYSETIFKLFARLNGRRFDGTGLGLAICQKIVEQYGGRIWADSKPDQGATFFFTLPAA